MSTDLEKKTTNASMAAQAVIKENGDMFDIRDKFSAASAEEDSTLIQDEKKILKRIDLW